MDNKTRIIILQSKNESCYTTVFHASLPVCRHFEMELKVLRCTTPSPSLLIRFFADRFVVLIIVITRGRPVRTRAFSPSFTSPCIPRSAVSSTLDGRFRSSQLHFFPGRGKNKTMILSTGITPLPTCPEQHRRSSETPKTISQNS